MRKTIGCFFIVVSNALKLRSRKIDERSEHHLSEVEHALAGLASLESKYENSLQRRLYARRHARRNSRDINTEEGHLSEVEHALAGLASLESRYHGDSDENSLQRRLYARRHARRNSQNTEDSGRLYAFNPRKLIDRKPLRENETWETLSNVSTCSGSQCSVSSGYSAPSSEPELESPLEDVPEIPSSPELESREPLEDVEPLVVAQEKFDREEVQPFEQQEEQTTIPTEEDSKAARKYLKVLYKSIVENSKKQEFTYRRLLYKNSYDKNFFYGPNKGKLEQCGHVNTEQGANMMAESFLKNGLPGVSAENVTMSKKLPQSIEISENFRNYLNTKVRAKVPLQEMVNGNHGLSALVKYPLMVRVVNNALSGLLNVYSHRESTTVADEDNISNKSDTSGQVVNVSSHRESTTVADKGINISKILKDQEENLHSIMELGYQLSRNTMRQEGVVISSGPSSFWGEMANDQIVSDIEEKKEIVKGVRVEEKYGKTVLDLCDQYILEEDDDSMEPNMYGDRRKKHSIDKNCFSFTTTWDLTQLPIEDLNMKAYEGNGKKADDEENIKKAQEENSTKIATIYENAKLVFLKIQTYGHDEGAYGDALKIMGSGVKYCTRDTLENDNNWLGWNKFEYATFQNRVRTVAGYVVTAAVRLDGGWLSVISAHAPSIINTLGNAFMSILSS